jgi:uncharacterized delta-60 repeat protein
MPLMRGIRCWVFALVVAGLLFVVGSAEAAGGSLDPSFGSDGVATTWLNGNSASALVIQPDGKLVVVGTWTPTGSALPSSIALARYSPTGVPDPGFGNNGVVTTALGGLAPGTSAGAEAAVLQPDGKIVAAGWGPGAAPKTSNSQFTLVRYSPDGSLDTSFGNGGVVTTTLGLIGSTAYSVVLQPDGKIVAGGHVADSAGDLSALVRYLPDGTLDTSFGYGGSIVFGGGYGGGLTAVALQPDGKILAVGGLEPLTRFNEDGTRDPSFGAGGVSAAPTAGANALALQPDGKIVVAGGEGASGPTFGLVRVNSDGTADTSFGTGGVVTTQIGSGNATASGVAVQPDGKIVAAGRSASQDTSGNPSQLFTVARYTTGGSLDSTFGGSGIVTTLPSSTWSSGATAVALQPDGKIDAAGWAAPVGWVDSPEFMLARYLVSSRLSVSRGGNGTGAVTSNPAGIDCGEACSGDFEVDTVTLTALPAAGSVFVGWSGACTGTIPCTVTLNADQSVTATFQLKPACIVPKLKGRSLKVARHRITHAHCRTGAIHHRYSKVKKGHVVSQRPRASRHLRNGARVSLVVSKGRRR